MSRAEPDRGATAALPLSPHAARYNLRDYGGYAVASGGRVRQGLLLRSGQLDDALPADEGLLARLGVQTVIDLRSASEIGQTKAGAYHGFAGRVCTAACEDGVIPHAIKGLIGLGRAEDVAAKMIETYRLLPGSPRFREGLTHYFAALAEPGGATLIHCFAGKDRTGLAVALLHLVLGVHRDDMVHDYLLTNSCGEERIAAGIAVLRRQSAADVREDVLREAMGVRADYLAAALAVIGEEAESPATWVGQVTGLGESGLERIRQVLIA
ncbi:MAG TPA: tyrosine-protein phosphatase [Novosphingobium sp.]|nr:tyrosine-protein phosphatase [Novosphingobium sp.]HMP57252.1 tyrosine-protein phosphatase [Novosphingobium sp.]